MSMSMSGKKMGVCAAVEQKTEIRDIIKKKLQFLDLMDVNPDARYLSEHHKG